jgi:hypothetical protein
MKTKISLLSALIMEVCFIPLKNSGQEISTVGEIYNFEVGDIFHYQNTAEGGGGSNGYYSLENKEIIEKYYSADSDTVYYVRDIAVYEYSYPYPEPSLEFYTDTVHYSNLNSILLNIDSVYTDPDWYNNRVINYEEITNETSINSWKYVVGCGRTSWYWEDWEMFVHGDQELIYFNKGGEEWGTPIYVGINEKNEQNHHVCLFPNPATFFMTINVTGGQPIEEAIIYNHLGQKVLKAKPLNNTVDVSVLQPGIYFVEVKTKDDLLNAKLIIE